MTGIATLLLAAGRAERFGGNKLLEPFDGKPLLCHALAAAQKVCPGRVHLVAGHDAARLTAVAGPHADRVIVNPDPSRGLASSIGCGMTAAGNTDAEAVIVMLADQPLIDAAHLCALIDRWRAGDGDCVATGFTGIAGPPALFARPLFKRLSELTGDRGARELLNGGEIEVLVVPNDAAAVDIDTPDDLQKLRNIADA